MFDWEISFKTRDYTLSCVYEMSKWIVSKFFGSYFNRDLGRRNKKSNKDFRNSLC